MLDLALIDLFATQLEAASAFGAWLDSTGNPYGVSQKEQPTQQGVTTDPQIFFEKLYDVPFGYPEVSHSINNTDPNNPQMVETELQLVETTFQVSALVIQEPSDLTIPTASDVVNLIRSFLISRQTIRLWAKQGVSLLRVTQVRNSYFEDDRHRNEASPNFDIVLTHNRTISQNVNSVSEMDGEIFVV